MIFFYKKQQANQSTGRYETMLFNVSTEQSLMQKSYPSPSITWWVTDRLNIKLVMRSQVIFTVVAEGWKLGSRRKIGMLAADWGNSPTANCPKAII